MTELPRREFLRQLATATIGCGFGLAGCNARSSETQWTMLNVSPREHQADAHLLELPSGFRVLIDCGEGADAPGTLLQRLKIRRVRRLDLVVLSHFHRDHYGCLLDLLRADIQIRRVVCNVPAQMVCEREAPWGCDWPHVQETLRFLQDRAIPYARPDAGEVLCDEKDSTDTPVRLEVLCAYDGVNTPIGVTDVNDTSIVMRLSHGNTRVLFTGDLHRNLGAHLAQEAGFDLGAQLLKAPHHGTETTVPDEFLDRVNARAVLVPSPAALWHSPRSKRMRDYYRAKSIPVYVSGVHGDVTVRLRGAEYFVEPEFADSPATAGQKAFAAKMPAP